MSKFRVLVVDDDQEMVEMLRRHLEGEGYSVRAVTSGQLALKALDEEGFDVVLVDLVMDEGDGIAVPRHPQQPQAEIRVLLMTAFGSLETAIEAMRLGAYDYLTKPFKLAEASI